MSSFFILVKRVRIFALTNDIVSFEQLGPDVKATCYKALLYPQLE